MTEEKVTFSDVEIAKVMMTLSRICRACNKADTCAIFTSNCPIGMSRNLLLRYKEDQHQIRAEIDLAVEPARPLDAVFPENLTRQVLDVIPELCNKCMFHADKCFLNIVYTWMQVLFITFERKPWSERPPTPK